MSIIKIDFLHYKNLQKFTKTYKNKQQQIQEQFNNIG